jgi:type IV pilus assembly protein PilE
MIVLAVLAILVTIAIPSYQRYVQRAQRSEAIRLILAIADCQERIRASSGYYDTTRCVEDFAIDSHELLIGPPDNETSLEFSIIAQPADGWTDDCGSLGLDQAGTRTISGAPEDLYKCWGGR